MVTTDAGAPRLHDQRVLVVGASSGVGRAIALAVAEAGAQVALVARRLDRLREVEEEAGAGALALQCDVRVPIACELSVRTACQQFGGLDAVVYATGIHRVSLLADTDLEAWRELIETNLVGAALITRAALPALVASRGRVAFVSSHSASDPWPGLGAYAASKAGLEAVAQAWQTEVPSVHFGRVIVGPQPIGVAEGWEPTLADLVLRWWEDAGYLDATVAANEWVADGVVGWLAAADPPPEVRLVAPPR